MKISFTLSSLCELIPSLRHKSPKDIGNILTNLGMETDSIDEIQGIKNLLVVQVVSCEPFDQEYQVVLKTDNPTQEISLSLSLTVPLGKYLLFSQTQSKEINELGVLSQDTEFQSRLPAAVFTSEHEAHKTKTLLEKTDFLFCIDIAGNRPDLLSIHGIAKSLSIYLDESTVASKSNYLPQFFSNKKIEIKTKNCSRYFLSEIKIDDQLNITPIRRKLQTLGMNCVSPFIDLSNWLMILCGQPTHVFDASKIEGGIHIREAVSGEKITLLDNSEILLESGDLLIVDDKKIIALAGIMGCKNSSVDIKTKHILLESAHFNSLCIHKTSKRLKLKTNASVRFEKNISPTIAEVGHNAFCTMVHELSPSAQISKAITVKTDDLPKKIIQIDPSYIKRYLGCNKISEEFMEKILGKLGKIDKQTDLWKVDLDPERSDLTIPEDLIEEIARFYGYNKIPANDYRPLTKDLPTHQTTQEKISELLRGMGLSEAITMVFRSKELLKSYAIDTHAIELNNPLTNEWTHLRPYLFDGLCETLKLNVSKAFTNKIALSEFGSIFHKKNQGFCESRRLAMLIFNEEKDPYYKALSIFYAILKYLHCNDFTIQKQESLLFLHPHNSFEVLHKNEVIGFFGQLHPGIAYNLKLSDKEDFFMPVIAEIDINQIQSNFSEQSIEISEHPPIFREITLSIPESILGVNLIEEIRINSPINITELRFLSVYQNEKLLSEKKRKISLELRFESREVMNKDSIDKYIFSLLELYQ